MTDKVSDGNEPEAVARIRRIVDPDVRTTTVDPDRDLRRWRPSQRHRYLRDLLDEYDAVRAELLEARKNLQLADAIRHHLDRAQELGFLTYEARFIDNCLESGLSIPAVNERDVLHERVRLAEKLAMAAEQAVALIGWDGGGARTRLDAALDAYRKAGSDE